MIDRERPQNVDDWIPWAATWFPGQLVVAVQSVTFLFIRPRGAALARVTIGPLRSCYRLSYRRQSR